MARMAISTGVQHGEDDPEPASRVLIAGLDRTPEPSLDLCLDRTAHIDVVRDEPELEAWTSW
jgi:hypothetical protein